MLKCMLLFVGLLFVIRIDAELICQDDCYNPSVTMIDFTKNGICNDYYCVEGYDCSDCGPVNGECFNHCYKPEYRLINHINNEICEDDTICVYGTDCTDCGARGDEPTTTTQASIDEVECTAGGVIVTVAADSFPFGNTMLLGGDINCAGTEIMDNDVLYYRFTTSDFESCGMSIVNTTDDYIVYHTVLMEGGVSMVDIYCNMERRTEVNMNVTANPCIITASLEGFGTFTFRGSLYENDGFIALHDPDVPLDMCDGSDIYFGIGVDYNGDDVELFVEYCYVTEDPDDDASPMYYLINNGCPNTDYDVVPSADNALSPLKKDYTFSAYEFVYTHDLTMLYIRCGTVICDLGDANSLCAQGCFSGRMKRGEHTSESTIITQGPYPLQGCPY